MKSFYLLSIWTYSECECDFEYRKHVGERNFFIGWHNVEVYALPGPVHATFYPGHRPWWPEFKSCRVLTVPTPPVFSYYSDLVILHQPGQGLVSSIVLIEFTTLNVLQRLGACHDGTVVLTCHDASMCSNGPSVLGHPASKDRECVDEIGLSSFLGVSLLIPFIWLSPRQGLLRLAGQRSARLIRSFRTVRILGRYLSCLRVIRPFRLSAHLNAMFLSLERHG